MPLPTEVEKQKCKKKLESLLKKVNSDGSPKRVMDDNLAKGLMRDAVRKKWMYCPTKLSFLLMNRLPNDGLLEGRCRWVQQCNICKKYFKEQDVNVDHISGEIKFTEWSEAQPYASSVLDVKHADLQILCIEDHKTKSRAEQLGLDWRTEEGWRRAKLEQEFTRIIDSKAKGQKDWITSKGLVAEKNEDLRKVQIRNILFGEK